MKFLLLFFFVIFLYADKITVINGLYPYIDIQLLQTYAYTAKLQSSEDMQRHKYTFVLLSKLKNIYCPNSTKIKFVSYNNNSVTFTLEEILKNNIAFVFKQNDKFLLEKGPAEIIYIKNKNPLKELCTIRKMICIDE